MTERLLLLVLCALLMPVASLAAPAHAYPVKPVRVIVQGAVGSGPDVLVRHVGEHLRKHWDRPVVFVNRPGAGGLMLLQSAAAAEHDGYTLLVPTITTFVILPEMHEKLAIDPHRDLVPIGLLAQTPMAIAAAPALGVSNLAELAAASRARPNAIFYAANNRGSLPHLTAELWRQRADAPMTFVPYAGAAAGLQDLLRGRISVIIESISALSGAIQSRHHPAPCHRVAGSVALVSRLAHSVGNDPGFCRSRMVRTGSASWNTARRGSKDQRRPAQRAWRNRIATTLRGAGRRRDCHDSAANAAVHSSRAARMASRGAPRRSTGAMKLNSRRQG